MKAPLLSIGNKNKYKISRTILAQPDSPEASIRRLCGMSIFSRGVAINLSAL
jgi:hypothetical protein